MDHAVMTQAQESTADWKLGPGEAVRLPAGAVARLVSVSSGRLWLTRADPEAGPAGDVWLSPGQSAALAPGEEAVVEAWPLARFAVLEAPALARRPVSARRAASWVRQLRERLQWAPSSAASAA